MAFFGTSGRLVNHSAFAQDCNTSLATSLPASAFSVTSLKASNTSKVFFSASPAAFANSLSSNA